MADHAGSTATASPSVIGRAAAASDAHGDRVAPGTWIDRYEVIEVLGAGSMGRVYRAHHSDLRRDVALKYINHGRGNREAAQARLRREALAMARIEHPAVVRLDDAQIVEGDLFVAMELARGGTFAEWMGERSRSWRDIVRVLVEAGRGLAAAHGVGLIHRDIKPSNILHNRGELQRRRRRCPDALRDFTRAAGLAETVQERGASILIYALVGEGGCLLEQRRFGDAIARLNRALKLKAPPDAAFLVALAHVYLGRTSVEMRRDVAGGLAAVRAARAAPPAWW